MGQWLSSDSKIATFTDDTTLYCLTHNVDLDHSTTSIQRSLNSLYNRGQHWKIRFEPAKTQRELICRRHPTTPNPILTFDDIPIEITDRLKLLGITFDVNLSFRLHLLNLAVRTNCRMGFLHEASRILDQTGRITACKGFTRPLLEYAHLAWMGAALA